MASITKGGINNGSARRIDAAERQKKALALRRDGATYEAIAEALGYKNPSGAHKAIKLALKNTIREPANELRELELQRLDRAQLSIAQLVQKGDLKAIDRWLRISHQRCALLGLNAPVEVKVQEIVRSKVESELNLLFEAIASDAEIPVEAKQRMFAVASQLQDKAAMAEDN